MSEALEDLLSRALDARRAAADADGWNVRAALFDLADVVVDLLLVMAQADIDRQSTGFRPCADGSMVHDFKGGTRCPACGIDGLKTPDVAPSSIDVPPDVL